MPCTEDKTLVAVELKKRCRYHKVVGQCYDPSAIAPEGLCWEAYHIAYPYLLALLYDAEFKGSCHGSSEKGCVTIRCPEGKVLLELRRIQKLPKPLKTLKSMVDWFFKRIDHPLAVVDTGVRIKVLTAPKYGCNMLPGQVFWMNIRNTKELCPASFDALYPFMRITDESKKLQHVHCPDHQGILYEVQ